MINFEKNEHINFEANSDEANLVNNLEHVNYRDENFDERRDFQTNFEPISLNLVENITPERSQALNVDKLVNQNQSTETFDRGETISG